MDKTTHFFLASVFGQQINYIRLLCFLENPDKDWKKSYDELMQPTLF